MDRVGTDAFLFGEEFRQNNGANVVCNYDPETMEIYWTIPGREEPILDEDGNVDESAGVIENLPARINNKALILNILKENFIVLKLKKNFIMNLIFTMDKN